VRRAKEIGLPYRTYATVRAKTGQDIVAFLFSNNALRIHRAGQGLPEKRAEKLKAVRRCGKLLAAHAPLDSADTLRELQAAGVAFEAAI